jgi:hypothetical protein
MKEIPTLVVFIVLFVYDNCTAYVHGRNDALTQGILREG